MVELSSIARHGRPFTLSDPCVERGAKLGYDADATKEATTAVKRFLISLWEIADSVNTSTDSTRTWLRAAEPSGTPRPIKSQFRKLGQSRLLSPYLAQLAGGESPAQKIE